MQPKDVMALIKEKGIQAVDIRFVDLPGLWQHFTLSTREFSEDAFEEGLGFDGSSIRGFQEIQESDMLLVPDASTAFVDPFCTAPTLVLIANVKDPVTGESYSRDPRYIAQKAESYLKSTGIGDTAFFGPEPEFFILDDVRFSQGYDTASTISTPRKGSGTPERKKIRISGISPATRKATSRCRRWTATRTFAPR